MREDDAVTEAETPDAPARPPLSRSDAALAGYRARMRRARWIYFGVVGVIVIALVAVVAVAWSRGEAAHASLHTFAPPPKNLAIEAPSAAPHRVWSTTDRVALGGAPAGGTVVTYSAHTVGGRDARTGKRTWSYTRTDRTVCTVAQATNTTIAVYANKGNCDELSAFDSDTGRRRWTRTLDKDGKPINGRPAYQVLPYTFLVTSDTTIYAIDPVTGLDRWTYYRYGCRIAGAVIGSAGALISQNCSNVVHCAGLKFCARGPQLLLRDGSAGNGEDSDANRDKMKWLRRGNDSAPVSADDVISTLGTDGRTLVLHSDKDGAPTHQLTLAGGSPATITAAATTGAELIWSGGKLYAVGADSSTPLWVSAVPAAPTVVSATGEQVPALTTARITAPGPNGVASIAGSDGRITGRFAIPAPADSTVYPLGTGFLVTGRSGATAYA
jgi:outer membrane protein assembly factor BamB